MCNGFIGFGGFENEHREEAIVPRKVSVKTLMLMAGLNVLLWVDWTGLTRTKLHSLGDNLEE